MMLKELVDKVENVKMMMTQKKEQLKKKQVLKQWELKMVKIY